MALGAPKFGRTIKILLSQPGLGDLVLVDWQGGQEAATDTSLEVDFTVDRHCKPEPQAATVEVRGLSALTIGKVVALHKAAESQAFADRRVLRSGKLTILAGYGDDAGVLFVGDLAPDGAKTRPGAPSGRVLTLRAQDGRIEWESRFVRRSMAPGVDLRTIQGVLAASGDYLSGADATKAFESQFPELVTRREGPAVKEGGFVMFGPSRLANRNLCRDAGLLPFYVDAQVKYVAADTATQGVAVVLREGETILSAEEGVLGYYKVRTLLDQRYRPGLQVVLVRASGAPIGNGVFRTDSARITGSNYQPPFDAELELRPTRRTKNIL